MDLNQSVPKILVVDDEPDVEVLMKQRFRKQLQDNKLEFLFAQNGVEALDILKKEPSIHLVISDINMPKMDGLTLLKNISQSFPSVIPIIVSAYGDMNNIRTAMNLGAFDFVTKPINFDDLNTTIDKTLGHVKYLLEAASTKNQLTIILQELNVASRIQQSILPRNFIDTQKVNVFGKMLAAKEVGGDFYDFFWLDDAKQYLAIVIADVSGKGVPAALFMTVSRTLFRAYSYQSQSPGQTLQRVNDTLCKDNANIMFVTAFYGILDVNAGSMSYSNAGHNYPFIIRKDKTVEAVTKSHDVALGVVENVPYHEDTVQLLDGDLLFLYTDGITEAQTQEGQLYGEARLIAQLKEHQNLGLEEFVNAVRLDITHFVGDFAQSDDITMLAVKYLSATLK